MRPWSSVRERPRVSPAVRPPLRRPRRPVPVPGCRRPSAPRCRRLVRAPPPPPPVPAGPRGGWRRRGRGVSRTSKGGNRLRARRPANGDLGPTALAVSGSTPTSSRDQTVAGVGKSPIPVCVNSLLSAVRGNQPVSVYGTKGIRTLQSRKIFLNAGQFDEEDNFHSKKRMSL